MRDPRPGRGARRRQAGGGHRREDPGRRGRALVVARRSIGPVPLRSAAVLQILGSRPRAVAVRPEVSRAEVGDRVETGRKVGGASHHLAVGADRRREEESGARLPPHDVAEFLVRHRGRLISDRAAHPLHEKRSLTPEDHLRRTVALHPSEPHHDEHHRCPDSGKGEDEPVCARSPGHGGCHSPSELRLHESCAVSGEGITGGAVRIPHDSCETRSGSSWSTGGPCGWR